MSPLLPIAGTAALSLAGETARAIGSGLSFATELLRQDNDAATAPRPIELPPSPAEQRLEQAIRDFVNRLRERLASAGIELAGPLVLESDGLGRIQVGGERSDESAIEDAVGDDRLLAEFNRLAEMQESLGNRDDRLGDFGLLIADEEAEVIWQ
jgi:hypothetical protein